MKRLFQSLTVLLVVLLMTGCPGSTEEGFVTQSPPPPPPPSIWTTSNENVPHNLKEKMDTFETGRYPAFVISGCHGLPVTIQVVENYHGTTKHEITKQMNLDPGWIQVEGILKGSYTVYLWVNDQNVDSYPFKILR